jgi:DNA primase
MTNKVDFAALRSGVSIDSVLSRYGVQTKRRNSKYLTADCPLPSHPEKAKHNSSFSVNVEEGLWTCHDTYCQKAMGMKGGDVIDFVCVMEGTRQPLDGAKKLAEWFPTYDTSKNGAKTDVPPATVSAEQTNKPLAFTLKDINPEHQEIQRRNISVETAKSFGVGFFSGKGSMANRIVFPVYENKSLVAYIGRTCGAVTANNPKWKVPAGFVKSILYGLDRCDSSRPLVVVESPWAVLWLYQKNVQAAALLGCEMTAEQEKAVEPFATIQLALDNDDPGRVATVDG